MTTIELDQKAPNQRRSDLDWLRLIAILILLFFHTGMWFNTWSWHVKNPETSESFNYWMIWLHHWRMPLLLFISGAGTYMALGKRTPKQFAIERFRRLFIPLVFGMFVVVPPQIYYEHIAAYNGYWDFYKTVFDFVPYPRGNFSWHHLWFIVYLLLYSMLLLPFLIFLRSPRSSRFRNRMQSILSGPNGILWAPAIFIFLTQLLLRPFFPEETHDLKDPAYFVNYGCFFLFGMICYSNPMVWEAIGRNRKVLLKGAVIVLIPFYIMFFRMTGLLDFPLSSSAAEIIFDITSTYLSWFTVITLIAYGQHYLNKPHPWLKYINEGLYPFYILHQTAIIAIGYYVCKLDWSIAAKYGSICLLTLLGCTSFFMICIRTNNPMRLFFGLKPH